jgi:hypothetical protein
MNQNGTQSLAAILNPQFLSTILTPEVIGQFQGIVEQVTETTKEQLAQVSESIMVNVQNINLNETQSHTDATSHSNDATGHSNDATGHSNDDEFVDSPASVNAEANRPLAINQESWPILLNKERPSSLPNSVVDHLTNSTVQQLKTIYLKELEQLLNSEIVDRELDLEDMLTQIKRNCSDKSVFGKFLSEIKEQNNRRDEFKSGIREIREMVNSGDSEQELLKLLKEHHNTLGAILGDMEDYVGYVTLHQKFLNRYQTARRQLLHAQELLVNSLKALHYLNKNLAATGDDQEHSVEVKKLIESLGISRIMSKWIKAKCQVETMRSCLQSREYELKCQICEAKTGAKNPLQVFNPCGHLSCEHCSKQIVDRKCPFCRKHFAQTIRVFLN